MEIGHDGIHGPTCCAFSYRSGARHKPVFPYLPVFNLPVSYPAVIRIFKKVIHNPGTEVFSRLDLPSRADLFYFVSVRTADFDYPLPSELIAQRPAQRRDQSRLLVLDRSGSALFHRRFFFLTCSTTSEAAISWCSMIPRLFPLACER